MSVRPLRRDLGDMGDDEPLLATLLDLEGTRSCAQPLCESKHGVVCEYRDRRNRPCATAWCPEHRILIDGQVLCRRHAGVVNALPAYASGDLPPPPDIDSRAASLAGWVARDIDAQVRVAIALRLGIHVSAVVSSAVALILVGAERSRAWERAWHARGAGGSPLRVAVVVEENSEGEVCLHVDGELCARLAPPWIGTRDVGPDDPRRHAFNAALIDALSARLQAPGAA
jgi:hypothetical protein